MQKFLLAAVPLLAPALLAQGTPEAAEPNNTTASAAVLALGAQAFGDIDASGTDEDWFKITLTSAADLRVFTAPGFAGEIGDTRVRLYAADGTTILIDVDDGNTTEIGYYTTWSLGGVAAGDYYVAVRGYDSTTFGSYTLDVIAAPVGTYVGVFGPLTPAVEGPEDNDPRNVGGVATATALDTSNSGNIATGANGTGYAVAGADYDFYQIVVPTAGLLRMATSGGPSPTGTDTVIHLVDSSLARIAFDDDSGPGFYSLLSANVSAGIYYVAVSDYSTGNYVLDIGFLALPTGPSSVTIQAGGCAGSAGTPSLATRQEANFLTRPEQPVLGSTFVVDATSLPPNAPMFTLLGFVPLAVPIDLGFLGAPGCVVEVDAAATNFALADGAGVLYWSLATPVVPALIGLPLEQQVAVLDPAANSLGITVSNRVSSVTGISL
jgi:hypothetical protein